MIVLRSDRLKDIVLSLGNRLNEILQVISEIYAYSPDNETMNKMIRELRSKSPATLVKGNTNVTTKIDDIEVIYTLTANGYKDAIRDAINYYTNVLMSIKQAMEFTEKLGVNDDYVIIIDDASIDVVIGYSLPDMSETSLLYLPNIRETTEIPSILSSIVGLTADEVARLMKMIDEIISSISNNSRNVETIVKLDNINYPEPFRKIEEEVGGLS
ncbi:hypothetical protein VMUT_1808 [Vulcanisaeta moutnovskia 768-28]|uniref:Uncharacterized protein n=1 Tax=Vulcanisaeta moutnovskia (strain 768-28) TaxID=985053 RepID=F0QVA7_VULM7|nr:hypothetical protein [Vulcanisaeta moutnovskia]ADY02009.1 hypothetical protein VMUT_1808 [Vulcanisaeta moutnovskia 768-28]